MEWPHNMCFRLSVQQNKVRARLVLFWTPSRGICSDVTFSDYYSQCIPGSAQAPTTTQGNSNPAPTGGSGTKGELNDKFKAKGKLYFGTEIDSYHLNNAALTTIVKNDFGQITNENSLKWDATERECLESPFYCVIPS